MIVWEKKKVIYENRKTRIWEKKKKLKKSSASFFPEPLVEIRESIFYSYVECIYMLIINDNSLTINFSYITFATAKWKKRYLTTATTTTTTTTTILISRWPKNQRWWRHRRRLGTSASYEKTGYDAADSDAAGSDAGQPGERSPPDPDVALRNPRHSLVPANVVDDFAFFVINVVVVVFCCCCWFVFFEQRLNLSFPSTFVDA